MSLLNNQSTQTPALEWVLGALGATLLAMCIGFLIRNGAQGADVPGTVTIEATHTSALHDQYLVEFEVRNAGTQTLNALNVTARLLDGEKEIETAQAVIDYVPGRSTRKGGFYFQVDPNQHQLELDVGGYQTP
jgi:uncharacterized protein (TIGR02588 family)